MIERATIANLIPHAGDMCLLDCVTMWTADAIRCTTASHRQPHHPLACNGVLSAACGVEYAAQAIAVHGALLRGHSARAPRGLLVSVRALTISSPRLDSLHGELVIYATRLAGETQQMSYQFMLSGDGRVVLQGRVAVILDVAQP